MKKLFLIPLAILLMFQFSCEHVLQDDMTLKSHVDDKDGKSGTVLEHAALPNYVPCDDYEVDLLVSNDPLDLSGKYGTKIGTMKISNDNSNLYLDFTLDPDLFEDGCYINKVSAYVGFYEKVGIGWYPYARELSITIGPNQLSSYQLVIPRNYISNQYPIPKDVSFDCGDNLKIIGYAEVCCPGGNLGAGVNGGYTIENGSFPMYYGNDDNYIGTLNVAIINGNLVITYQTTTIGMDETHIHISTDCSFPSAAGSPVPGLFTYGSHKGQGTFSQDKKTYSISIPLSDLESILGDEDLCEAEFCVLAHAELSNDETLFAGENKVSAGPGGRWYRYFQFTIDCRPPLGGDPECFDVWAKGNSRICIITDGLFPDRFWYWAIVGYIYCCD